MCSRAKPTVAKVGKSLQNAMSEIEISSIIDTIKCINFFLKKSLAAVGEGYLVTSAFG